jgi:hypothetical protein
VYICRHGAGRSWATDICRTRRVVRYRGQLLLPPGAQDVFDNQTQTAASTTHQLREGQARSQEPVLRQVPPAWREEAADAAGVNVSYCRRRCHQRSSWPGTWRRSRSCEPLSLSPSLARQPRCAEAMHCVSSHVYASRTLTHPCRTEEVQQMRPMNERSRSFVLLRCACRLGAENIPIQPVHPVPPGMRFAHAVAAEPFGRPIDFIM